jgi:hypothetical protein
VRFYCSRWRKVIYCAYQDSGNYHNYNVIFQDRDEAAAYSKLIAQMFKRVYEKVPWSYYKI